MTTPALIIPVGQDQYALPAHIVREVVSDPRPTRLPTAPEVFLGAFNLRGEVVPIFDTAMLLGIGRLNDPTIAVVINTPSGPAGLVVSSLPKVAVLADQIGPSEMRGTVGVYAVEDDIAVLVDIDALLQPHTSFGATLTDGSVGR